MTALRLLPAGDDALHWSLRDDADAEAGHGVAANPAQLPAAASTDLVIPAHRMRTVALGVPPVSGARLEAVVRFALEEQLAGDVETQHMVIARHGGGNAIVHVVERAWLVPLIAALAAAGHAPRRVVAESDLLTADAGALATWVWAEDGGFLLRPDGRVSVLDQADEALPAGLLLTLPAGGGGRVDVLGPAALQERCASWSASTGTEFAPGSEWSWRTASGRSLSGAVDLATPALQSGRAPVSAPAAGPWRRAAFWLGAALLLHVGASVAEWSIAAWRTAGLERAVRETMVAAAPALAATPTADLPAAWRRAHAAARHRAGRAAPDDALPLLAVLAGPLSALPPGALRTINYQPGQMTLDFEPAGAGAVTAAADAWARAGLQVLQAPTPAGLRVRVTRP